MTSKEKIEQVFKNSFVYKSGGSINNISSLNNIAQIFNNKSNKTKKAKNISASEIASIFKVDIKSKE